MKQWKGSGYQRPQTPPRLLMFSEPVTTPKGDEYKVSPYTRNPS